MAKDPAFLFYSSDFLSGTALFSNEQRGIYIFLLCLQHQSGGICEEDMINICGTHVKVMSKFCKEGDGLFYNIRLKEEVEKRKNYSESRKKNRLSTPLKPLPIKKKIVVKSYVPHMENENEDVNEIKNEEYKGGAGGKPKSAKPILFRESEFFDYPTFEKAFENTKYSPYNIEFYYESVLSWSDKGNKKTDWIATVKGFMLRDFKEGKPVLKNGKQVTGNANGRTGKILNAEAKQSLADEYEEFTRNH